MRRIAVVTTSRADYGHLYWVLREFQEHPEVELRLLVTGAHPAPEFGSSSGIMEAASLELPVVNVGIRQQGRERAANVIDAPTRTEAILEAVERARSPGFRASLEGIDNPYGDGRAAERIVRILTKADLGEELLLKRARPLMDAEAET